MLVFLEKNDIVNVNLSLSLNFGCFYNKNDMGSSRDYMDAWWVIDKLKNVMKNEDKFNYIIISMHVYNALTMSHEFQSYFGMDEIDGITEVGTFNGYKVFLDMYQKPDEILLSCDIASSRNYKIEQILEGTEFIKEKRVKIT
jgi:hypothetical protein